MKVPERCIIKGDGPHEGKKVRSKFTVEKLNSPVKTGIGSKYTVRAGTTEVETSESVSWYKKSIVNNIKC